MGGQRFRSLCILAAAALLPAAAAVHLKTRTLDGPEDLRVSVWKRKTAGRSHFVVDMAGAPGPQALAQWTVRGIRIAGHVPPFGLILGVPDGAAIGVPGMLWAGRLSAADKISPLVGIVEEPPAGYLVEFYPDVDMSLARLLAVESGLQLQEHPDLLPDQLMVLGSAAQVAGMAAWDEVAYVFPASADLLAGIHVLSCGGAATTQGVVAQYVKVSDGWSAGPNGVQLSFVFTALTSKLPASTVQSEVARALNEWTRYAPLLFTAGGSAAAARTINILFASGNHGDGYPFDGPGSVLAHTFYPAPPNLEPIAGDMHLDADEAWDNPQKIDLFSVALHETGHALGLGHSDRPGAVMYPYYRLGAQLSDDDIAGIRAIYAVSGPSAPPPTQPLSIQVLNPASSSLTVTASSMAMAGTVSGGAGNPLVTWTSSQGPAGTASGSTVWSIAVVPLNLGLNIITVTAVDSASSVASKLTSVTRQVAPPAANPTAPATPPAPTPPATPSAPPSASPPALKITTPAFTVVSTSAATIAVSGTAAGDVASVTWSNSTGSSGTAAGTVNWSATVPLVTGTNTVTVKAFNGAGSSWRSLTVVRR